MPLYEYGCEKCGHVVEKLQSNPQSPPPEVCAKCGAQGGMTRMISNSSFKLKGGGWYVTDYASPKSAPSSSGSESTSGEAAASSESAGGGSSSESTSTSADSTGSTSTSPSKD